MLDAESAAGFLLERGLIDPGAAGLVGWSVACLSRRHDDLRVEGPRGLGFLIKRASVPACEGRRPLGAEAEFSTFCQGEPAAAEVAELMPRLLHREANDALLTFELIRDADSIWSHHITPNANAFPADLGHALGRALGTLHRTFRRPSLADDPRLDWLPVADPWALSVHTPSPERLADLCPATYRLLQVVQAAEGLGERLDPLKRRWRAETVIHGDLKFDNVLFGREPRRVWLVDWERVGLGDPAWDLAGALQDFVHLWVASGRHDLADLRRASRDVWRGYRSAAGGDGELVSRAVAFSAARLIQTAYEVSAGAGVVPDRALVLLQVAVNILADPGLAQVQLYGITGDPPC